MRITRRDKETGLVTDVSLTRFTTLHLVADDLVTLMGASNLQNTINLLNMGPGNLWYSGDNTATINGDDSCVLPPLGYDNGVFFHTYLTIVADQDGKCTIRVTS